MPISRRVFVGGSAAALGATAFGLPDVAHADHGHDGAAPGTDQLQQPLLIRLLDAERDEYEILIGEQSISFSDPSLTNQIARTISKEGG